MQKFVGKLLGVLLLVGTGAMARDRALPAPAEARFIAADCAPLLIQSGAQRALQTARVLVQSQGMQVVVQGCPFVRTGKEGVLQVLDVRVVVVDSETASNFVRGPLADGEEVDMGGVLLGSPVTAKALTPVSLAQEDVSPDVQYNRQWLANVMRSRGWEAVPGRWWAFVPMASGK